VVLALALLVLAAVSLCGWMVYRGITVSLQAERNLHATIFTIRLVEQFVAKECRWPRSWEELDKLSFTDGHRVDWPAASLEIQRQVSIDFGADPQKIARQDPMEFTAIWPIGPYYEFRDYSYVASLQATLRKCVTGTVGQQMEP
jgi:hypothetical protein